MILEAAMQRQARLMLAGLTPQKAKFVNLNKWNPLTNTMRVTFNPNHIQYTRDIIYEHTPMPDFDTGGRMNYVGGSGGKLTMELFFDTTDTGDDVREYTDFLTELNPHSLEVLRGCKLEPSLGAARPGDRFQFERLGYFVMDLDSRPGTPVFNRTVTLKDSWARIERRG